MKTAILTIAIMLISNASLAAPSCVQYEYAELKDMNKTEIIKIHKVALKTTNELFDYLEGGGKSFTEEYQKELDKCTNSLVAIGRYAARRFKIKDNKLDDFFK